MWTFTVTYQPSGYSESTTLIFRVHAKDWRAACLKLYLALETRGILHRRDAPTLEEFELALVDSSCNTFGDVVISEVHPHDNYAL